VVTPGLFGLEPTPRNRALLNFRAVNSLKNVFGAKMAASLTLRTPSASSVSPGTAVTLMGTFWGSSGAFCAVTVIGGSAVRSCACAPAGASASASSAQPAGPGKRLSDNICEFSHMFL
jgi:hypothetical protein